MEIPFQLSGWDREARQLIAEYRCTVGQAVETVTLRYLRSGNYRPLFDSWLRAHVPGPKVRALLAAMLDPHYRAENSPDTDYEFVFKAVLKRGRPKKPQILDRFLVSLRRGTKELTQERDPRRVFWCYLFAALDSEYRRMVEEDIGELFPWRAKLQPIKRGRGRRPDPELAARDDVLARMVQQRMDEGEKYESAIERTLEAVENDGRIEKWRGWIRRPTVRNAYDRYTKFQTSK